MKKYLKALVEKVEKAEEGILSVAVATDESVDRDGERIAADAWDFTNFLKNPVLLWAHDYRAEPVGKILELTRAGAKTLFKPQFAIGITERAKQIFQFYQEGYLNAFSVGFIPREWKDEDLPGGKRVRTFTKVELLEISAVPVPSNPNALVLARGAKDADPNLIKQMETGGIGGCGHNDFKSACRAMALLLGAGGSKVPEADRQKEYDHLKSHYEEEKKEAPAYSLVESQVLKDVDLDTDMPIVVQVTNSSSEDLEKLKQDIDSLKKSIAGSNGTDGGGGRAPSKVDPIGELLSELGTKRLLQLIDRSVGEILRRSKSNNA